MRKFITIIMTILIVIISSFGCHYAIKEYKIQTSDYCLYGCPNSKNNNKTKINKRRTN